VKIFVSYPHQPPKHARLVERIVDRLRLEPDIEEVWFDNDHLLAGDDWPQHIVDGILASDCTIGFLSHYSVRDPGVCLKELSLSAWNKGGAGLVAVQLEKLDRLPISVSHVQTLAWDDVTARTDVRTSWFETKYAALLAVVRRRDDERRPSELQTVQALFGSGGDYFEQRINRYVRGYVGRRWLFDAVEQWAREGARATNVRPLFALAGAPGVGKSAWVSNLTLRANTRVIGFYFIDRSSDKSSLGDRIVRTFIRQMAWNIADFRRVLLVRLGLPHGDKVPLPEAVVTASKRLSGMSAAQLFKQFVIEVAEQSINRREKLLLVLDAIDEAATYDRTTDTWDTTAIRPLLALFEDLPPWLGVVVTSRPEKHLEQLLKSHCAITLAADDERNVSDLESWLRKHPVLASLPAASALSTKLSERATGNFRYAELALAALQRRARIDINDVDALPATLNEMYLVFFRWQFQSVARYRSVIAPVLGQALAAPLPLPLPWLARWHGWSAVQQAQFLEHVGSLLESVNLPEIGIALRPYHDTVRDWIESDAAGAYMLDMPTYRTELATNLWRDKSLSVEPTDGLQRADLSKAVLHAVDLQIELLLGSPRDPLVPGDAATCELRLRLALDDMRLLKVFRAPQWLRRMLLENYPVAATVPRIAPIFNAFTTRLHAMYAALTGKYHGMRCNALLLGCQWLVQRHGARSVLHAHTVAVLLREYIRGGRIRDGLRLAAYLEPLVLDRAWIPHSEDEALATMASAIAEAHNANHQPEKAKPFARMDVALSVEAKGPLHPDSARAKNNLALHLRATGERGVADDLLREALVVLVNTLPPGHHDTVATLSNLAVEGASDAELDAIEKALHSAMLATAESGDITGYARAAWYLGAQLEKRGDVSEARRILEKAVAACESYRDADPFVHAGALDSLASLLRAQKRYPESLRLQRRAIDIATPVYGVEHPRVIAYIMNLVLTLGAHGDYDAAIRESWRGIRLLEDAFGENDRAVAPALAGLGGLCLDGKRFVEGKAAYMRAIAIVESSVGSAIEIDVNCLRDALTACENEIRRTKSKGRGGRSDRSRRRRR
jgi:tetratricopeptide (TPR) repeat protein